MSVPRLESSAHRLIWLALMAPIVEVAAAVALPRPTQRSANCAASAIYLCAEVPFHTPSTL